MTSHEQHRELILLGTGTSVGVPVIGCDCVVCNSTNPRNQRTRTGVAVRMPAGTFVIDTPPELRLQLIREKIALVHAAVFTHSHADHIFGLDDLRICGYRLKGPVTLYCEEPTEQQIRQSFNYAFTEPDPKAHHFARPNLEFERIGLEPFSVLGQLVTPIRLLHGRLPVLGFRLGDVAFCTDVSHIPDESWLLLEGLDVLVLDALRDKPHPTHFGIDQALEVVERVKPRRTFFTHVSHELDYDATNARLPDGVELAYDGLRISF
jgi:phosphoribosyl 1,2-cyclic phosphate phosphodiesterase